MKNRLTLFVFGFLFVFAVLMSSEHVLASEPNNDLSNNGSILCENGHECEKVTTKATLEEDGKVMNVCKNCSYSALVTVYPKPDQFILSTTNYTYNGKTKKPSVIQATLRGRFFSGVRYGKRSKQGRQKP